jgi:UPF0755 protein
LPERTDEERERERAERERRRAERDVAAPPPPADERPAPPIDTQAPPIAAEQAAVPMAEEHAPPPVESEAPPPAEEQAAAPMVEPAVPPPEPPATVPESEAPPSGSRLPPAPPAAAASATRRRAGRPPAPAVPRQRRRVGRSLPSRAIAMIGLVAVAVAVVLLVKSLAGSGKGQKSPVATVVRVVIPEGATRLQIARIAAKDGLKGSYRGASKRSALLHPTQYGAPAGTPDLEGFLYPATYDMYPGAPVTRLVHEQLVAFGENFGSTEISRAHALHVTPYQLLTIASMVEREAKVSGDRAKIAAVIYNRLRRGMPLGIDATIYYALELQKNIPTYTKELTESQLKLDSPYNTRTRTGLPPTPIANPGMASIEAASNPAHVSYLYYVLAPDGCGEHVFSTTLVKFEADAAAYQAALRKNGGSPPACKK